MGVAATASYLAKLVLFLGCVGYAGYHAHEIRLYAIKTYGLVIHEFDPWFNYRATEYLAANGLYEFFHWFDYKVWYPLGRPVGTTIYPGMQMTSVFIWKILNEIVGYSISLNDVCCYVPAWFGVSATSFLGLLAAECSNSWGVGIFGAAVMSIIPAHLMRSVGGGYDNESIALTAMCMTFYLWCRSLRPDPKLNNGEPTRDSYLYGTLAGIAYIYMAAAWGGFIFVINLIAFHAGLLVLIGRYSSKLHRAYSLFYIIGTIGAMQIPVIGWRPVRSLEQISGLLVFIGFQALEFCEVRRRRDGLTFLQTTWLRIKVAIPALAALGVVVMVLYPMGYFGPLGARIRGLFVKHTRTGNPLVDSVAEHQPASQQAYKQYLHHIFHVVPYGFGIALLRTLVDRSRSDASSFLIAYACVAYYFANKMARLIILLGPISSALAGVALGFVFDHLVLHAVEALLSYPFKSDSNPAHEETSEGSGAANASEKNSEAAKDAKKKDASEKPAKPEKASKVAKDTSKKTKETKNSPLAALDKTKKQALRYFNNPIVCVLRVAVAIQLARHYRHYGKEFYDYCHQMAVGMSQPSIMFKARLRSGEEIIVDDYREGYWWLRDHTPEDSRVMAWWDYGYQITGIGNRTTIADGNTWNHEHIATLGRILSAPEKKAHRIARHLADYVLVWAGGGGDDLAKSPHMARIGNSVYHDICPHDPTCSKFGFYQGGAPTPMMRKSLLYKLTQYGYRADVKLDPNRFTHAYTTKYGKMRIFKIEHVSKKSKKWIADPKNRLCDAPGSWYCPGQYPPALHKLIAKRKPFRQLEDFNVGQDSQSKKYQEEYHKRMAGGHPLSKDKKEKKKSRKQQKKRNKRPVEDDEYDNEEDDDEPTADLGLKYIGCVGGENLLGADKVYGGGDTGANIARAMQFAWKQQKKYVAIARVGMDGHSFAFSELKSRGTTDDKGCKRECVDHSGYYCGCSDAACGSLKIKDDDEHLRRWVIYEVPAKPDNTDEWGNPLPKPGEDENEDDGSADVDDELPGKQDHDDDYDQQQQRQRRRKKKRGSSSGSKQQKKQRRRRRKSRKQP